MLVYDGLMPELPEVETTKEGLRRNVVGLKITDIWTDLGKKKLSLPHFKNTLKDVDFLPILKKKILGQRIVDVERRAKNILINFENGEIMLIHLKMTGHLMVGLYDFDKRKNIWKVHNEEKNEALRDPYNRFVHAVFSLSNPSQKSRASNKHLVFCDSRKFGKITLLSLNPISILGPEPLADDFTKKILFENLIRAKTKPIKQALLDQSIVAGIGNIYSDEILWEAGVNPKRRVTSLSKKEVGEIFKFTKILLKKGIDFGGDSMSDYRNIDGRPGAFHHHHNVYRKTGNVCGKCGCKGKIIREKIGGRSAHFCDKHQI